ncbi:MAG: hypothetical protein F6K31_18200 [Symploca sp. SIO2G7]|nr:hypothetical protein [Symploca sp. SIO2G7]
MPFPQGGTQGGLASCLLALASATLLSVPLFSSSLAIAKTKNLLTDNTPAHHHHDSGMNGEREGHSHGTREIATGQPVPAVDLIVHKDTMKGWNLEIKVSNFKFAPENANKEHISGEGHAHLYINNEKITRLYSNWFYLDNLEPGRYKITVTLNSNSHENFVYNDQIIADTEIIEIATP